MHEAQYLSLGPGGKDQIIKYEDRPFPIFLLIFTIKPSQSIVDFAIPQRFGPHGTHYYSFVTREYVLNLILYFYKEHKRFPHGDICIVDHWYWKSFYSGGRVFQGRKKGRNYSAGDWIYLPTLREVKKSKRIINEN